MPRIAERKAAALKIQTMYRGYQARQTYMMERRKLREAELEKQRLAELERQKELHSIVKIQTGKNG